MMSESDPRPRRQQYAWYVNLPTRWMDNDLYGHVNNVVYYSLIDTVVNRFLIERGGLEIQAAPVIGVTVESGCRYFEPVAYPDLLSGGLRVARLGRSSVVYEVGIFRDGDDEAAAAGRFVHVFVERESMKPLAIPGRIRAALQELLVSS
jgi:acyl-CoA thioester hydrolase